MIVGFCRRMATVNFRKNAMQTASPTPVTETKIIMSDPTALGVFGLNKPMKILVLRNYSIKPLPSRMNTRDAASSAPIWRAPQAAR
jgi:hypothetical protein